MEVVCCLYCGVSYLTNQSVLTIFSPLESLEFQGDLFITEKLPEIFVLWSRNFTAPSCQYSV